MEKISLYKILRRHIGKTFYSVTHGDVILDNIKEMPSGDPKFITWIFQFHAVKFDSGAILIRNDGKQYYYGSEVLYPSKDAYKQGGDYKNIWESFAEEQIDTYIELSLGSKYYNGDTCDEYADRFYFNSVEERTECFNKIKDILYVYKRNY